MTYIYFVNQMSAATASFHTAEVSGLKRKLGQAEEELGLVKKQLEANKGKRNPVHMSYRG